MTTPQENPFPGMNPYLERHWRDVHTTLMVYFRDQLQGQLPDGLWASVEEEITIDDEVFGTRRARPDVQVTESNDARRGMGPSASAAAVAEPLVLLDVNPQSERYVAIWAAGGHLVTAIEVLSPTNKTDLDMMKSYRRKRQAYLNGGANVVEIDLIRAGAYIVLAPRDQIVPEKQTPYIISVYRAAQPEVRFAYPCPLREPLPRIAVPLRPEDADVVLDVQAAMDQCYARGRYFIRIDYRFDPDPPLSPDDAAWAEARLRAAGLR